MNMVTGAALATLNRLPVLLLPGDTYATRHQGPVLQQLQHPTDADLTVNDAFRPVARFFDRITRPEQLLTALPAAMRTLVDPVETGAVVLSLPQDVQSHAYDFPAELFDERDWVIRRPAPDESEIDAVAALLAAAEKPLIIAGGGVVYSQATAELERLAAAVGVPVAETFAGKGAVQQAAWWQLGGIGLEGHPGDEHPGPGGGPGAHRRVPADRLQHRVPLDLRQPRRALRQHQRQRPRRGPTRRGRHHRRREAGPGRTGRRQRRRTHLRRVAGSDRGAHRGLEHRAKPRARPGPAVRQVGSAGRLRRGDDDRRGAHPGADHRGAAGARPGRRRDHRRRRRSSRRPAEGVGRHRRPDLPPRVRLLLHGLRDPGGDRRAAGAPGPGRPDHGVPRRRHLPDGTDRAGHRRPGGPPDHAGHPGEPRLPGHPPVADGPQRPRVRQRVPLPHHAGCSSPAQRSRTRQPAWTATTSRSTWSRSPPGSAPVPYAQ